MKPLIALIVLFGITTTGCSGGGSPNGDTIALANQIYDGEWSGSGGYYDSRDSSETLCSPSLVKITQTSTELHITSISTGCLTPLYPVNKWKFQIVGTEIQKDGVRAGSITASGFLVEDSLDYIEADFLASGTLHLTLSHSLSATDFLQFGFFLDK